MANLKDIRSRIASVQNTQKITKAMKMVSAAKLRRAQDNITSLRPYAKGLLSMIADIKVTQRVEHPLLAQSEKPERILLVAISSDRGLCGGFNALVSKYVEQFYKDNVDKYKALDLIVIGRKSLDYLNARNIPVKQSILNIAKDISFAMALEIAKEVMSSFKSGEYDKVSFVYNEFRSVIDQRQTSETILPVELDQSEFEKDSDSIVAKDLIFEPPPEEMMEILLQKHFATQVYRCLCESVAGEHAARMTAMDNATNNASDLVSELTLTYNKLRQAAITTEITEICSGAEALK